MDAKFVKDDHGNVWLYTADNIKFRSKPLKEKKQYSKIEYFLRYAQSDRSKMVL